MPGTHLCAVQVKGRGHELIPGTSSIPSLPYFLKTHLLLNSCSSFILFQLQWLASEPLDICFSLLMLALKLQISTSAPSAYVGTRDLNAGTFPLPIVLPPQTNPFIYSFVVVFQNGVSL